MSRHEIPDHDHGLQHRPATLLTSRDDAGVLAELAESDGASEATLLDFVRRKQAFIAMCGHMYQRTPEEIERWDARLCGNGAGADSTGGKIGESQVMAVFCGIMAYTYEHPSLADGYAARYIFGLPWLDDIIGHLSPNDFAESIGVKKQRVNQAIGQAYEHFKHYKLPLRAGMRDEQSRANMSSAYQERVGRKK